MHRNGQNDNHLQQNGSEYKWNNLFLQSPQFGIEKNQKPQKKNWQNLDEQLLPQRILIVGACLG